MAAARRARRLLAALLLVTLALALPPSYVFESLRAITNGGQADYNALLWALALSLLYLAAAAAFFAHVHGVCVRNGLIARYSAESVT
jgi:ABC-2 type transport system permease protein